LVFVNVYLLLFTCHFLFLVVSALFAYVSCQLKNPFTKAFSRKKHKPSSDNDSDAVSIRSDTSVPNSPLLTTSRTVSVQSTPIANSSRKLQAPLVCNFSPSLHLLVSVSHYVSVYLYVPLYMSLSLNLSICLSPSLSFCYSDSVRLYHLYSYKLARLKYYMNIEDQNARNTLVTGRSANHTDSPRLDL